MQSAARGLPQCSTQSKDWHRRVTGSPPTCYRECGLQPTHIFIAARIDDPAHHIATGLFVNAALHLCAGQSAPLDYFSTNSSLVSHPHHSACLSASGNVIPRLALMPQPIGSLIKLCASHSSIRCLACRCIPAITMMQLIACSSLTAIMNANMC